MGRINVEIHVKCVAKAIQQENKAVEGQINR